MQDQLKALLDSGLVPSTSLAPTSRYVDTEVRWWTPPGTADDGDPDEADTARVPYRSRRLCPAPERHAATHEVAAERGDRRDLLAARELGDAALWWRIADANAVLDPSTMTHPVGRRLRVTQAADVPGAPDAV